MGLKWWELYGSLALLDEIAAQLNLGICDEFLDEFSCHYFGYSLQEVAPQRFYAAGITPPCEICPASRHLTAELTVRRVGIVTPGSSCYCSLIMPVALLKRFQAGAVCVAI